MKSADEGPSKIFRGGVGTTSSSGGGVAAGGSAFTIWGNVNSDNDKPTKRISADVYCDKRCVNSCVRTIMF